MSLEQKKVWDGIKEARKLLVKARNLEYRIEEKRIAREVAASKWAVSGAVLLHDPLGERLEKVIEELEDIIS